LKENAIITPCIHVHIIERNIMWHDITAKHSLAVNYKTL